MATTLIVLENPQRWNFDIPGVEVVSARTYLEEDRFSQRSLKVFNFCGNYAYQSIGYYVSLLAAARGHTPLPSVATIQDLRSVPILRIASEDLEELLQKSLAPLVAKEFELNIYFGRNMEKRYDRLCTALFNSFPTPFLRAEFVRNGRWRLERLRPIATSDIPPNHEEFVKEQALRYFSNPPKRRSRRAHRYDLAILINPDEVNKPSDDKAIRRFIQAARELDIDARTIQKDDYGRIGEFDALFIRETTVVTNHTFRFAQRAAAEGLVVIDDPESIIRCSNKVYQAELFKRHNLSAPRTMVIGRNRPAELISALGLPCVLKKPDSSFSCGVFKALDEEQLRQGLASILSTSELAVAQEYIASEFDWRVGVIDGQALYVCKYFMAKGHWQVQNNQGSGGDRYGRVTTLKVEDAPKGLIDLAVKGASLIGKGFYGIDLKQVGDRFYIIEINDNPNVDSGSEDAVIKDELYLKIMQAFLRRLEQRGRGSR